MGCNWRSKVRGFPQGFPQFFDVFNRLWRLIGIVAKYFLAETLDFYAVCDPSLWQVAGSGTNIELHLRTKRGMASFFEGSSEFVNLVPQIYLGVSENSVPLNPMVNDHYPYFLWLFHWEYTQHFQTNPLHTSHAIASVLSFPTSPWLCRQWRSHQTHSRHRRVQRYLQHLPGALEIDEHHWKLVKAHNWPTD